MRLDTERRWTTGKRASGILLAALFALGPLLGCVKLLGDFTASTHEEGQDASTDVSPDRVVGPLPDGSADVTLDSPTADAPPGSIALGHACTSSVDCLSGACADGVCCQTRCVESCAACNLAGSLGTCTNLPAGMAPAAGHAVCAMESQASCGQDGTCDGMGQCALWNGVVCKAGSCDANANTAIGESKCDGQGSCVTPMPVTCAPYLCDPSGTGCYATCTASTQCVSPAPCLSGSCGPKANGGTCSGASGCTTGNCVDGYCCDGTCTGQCEACDLPATLGTCSPVTSGQPHGMRTACTGTSPCAGSCTSASSMSCTFPSSGVSCRAQSCSGSTLTAAAGCNAAGACPASTTTSCPGNLVCNAAGTGCLTTCSSSSDCVGGAACTGGSCGTALLANGASCSSGAQCQTGNCVDTYCCDLACSGACQACDVSGSVGACSPVTSGQPHGSRGTCSGSGACAGACSNASQTACTYPTGQCAGQTCSGGTLTAAAYCSGGSCPAGTTSACPNGFACNGASCGTSCSTSGNTGCNSGLYCNGGTSCLTTMPNGNACTSASTCTTGYCANGYCCNASCADGCDTCSATPGTCTPLGAGTNSGKCGNYLCEGADTCPTSCTSSSQCVVVAGSATCNASNQCTCFVAGTPVETEAGLRAIETVAPGERVRSFDTTTGRPSWHEVLKLERRVAPQIVEVSVGTGAPIHVSPEHYFWVTGSGWVRARDLAPGDELVASEAAGGRARVSALASLAAPASGVVVYNLVVEGFDDYFVGDTPVLVHSCHVLGYSSISESEIPQ